MIDGLILILDSTVRLSIPLLFAAMAGLYSERAGIIDIGLEGKMLAAAFVAAALAATSGSTFLALTGAIAISVALALIHGFACISHRGNHIVSGVAINFLAIGLTALIGQNWFGQGGRTPTVPAEVRFANIDLPLAAEFADFPILGGIYAELVSGHNILVYCAFIAVPLTSWIIFRTRFGLRLRAVGENPAAADTAGIPVFATRYRAVICCGILCGFAGSYLSIAQSAYFIPNMTAGRGFIALAALIFANWQPGRVLMACLLFGLLDAVAIRLQGQVVPGIGEMPVQLFQAFPYLLTVILLAGFIGRAVPPAASGLPYEKERA